MSIRATYEKGVFRPLESVEMNDGEQVELSVRRLDGPTRLVEARRQAIERLRAGLHLGGIPLTRDEVHRR